MFPLKLAFLCAHRMRGHIVFIIDKYCHNFIYTRISQCGDNSWALLLFCFVRKHKSNVFMMLWMVDGNWCIRNEPCGYIVDEQTTTFIIDGWRLLFYIREVVATPTHIQTQIRLRAITVYLQSSMIIHKKISANTIDFVRRTMKM